MLAMRDLDDWEDAEIVRKKTEACLAAVAVDPNGEQSIGATPLTDAEGRRIETFSPGMVAYGAPGFDVKFNQPSFAGGYADYKRSRVRDLATGLGMIYELLAGDLSQVNYSSYRSGLLGFRGRIEFLQWSLMIPMLCDPVAAWFISAAQDFSGLPVGEYPVEWGPPPFDLLDREAEAKADQLELQIGKRTWPQLVSEQGYDPEKQIAEIEQWQPRLDAAGVEFNPKGGNNANDQTAASAA
jgi:capsid protein